MSGKYLMNEVTMISCISGKKDLRQKDLVSVLVFLSSLRSAFWWSLWYQDWTQSGEWELPKDCRQHWVLNQQHLVSDGCYFRWVVSPGWPELLGWSTPPALSSWVAGTTGTYCCAHWTSYVTYFRGGTWPATINTFKKKSLCGDSWKIK